MRAVILGMAGWLLLTPELLMAGLGDKATTGDCSPIITGDIKAPVTIKCEGSDIPAAALAKLETYLQENYRSQKNLNDLIDKYKQDVADWEQKYKDAIAQNAADLKERPNDPLLEAERKALEAGELVKAAEIRDEHYQKLKQEKTAELAQEAFTAAERWEGAFNMHKALELYQEAVTFKRAYPEAWRSIGDIAKKLGKYQLALEAAQNLQKQLDPEKDPWWLAAAFADEGDAQTALGHNKTALEKYLQTQKLFEQLQKAEPDNRDKQRDLSVSYDRVGDMHKANGDNEAALKAYQESLAIRKKLAELDPRIVEWQTDLVVSYYKLAQIQQDKQKQLLGDALKILQKLHEEGRLDHEKQGWIPVLEQALSD